MDHTDSFIDEVTEEVRRDRLFAAFRKYGWIGVVAILGLVGGSAYVEWDKAQARARAEAFGDGVLSALEAENPAEAVAALPAEGPQVGLVKLLTAAQAAEDGKTEAALVDLRAIAGDATLPDSLRQLARLKAVLVAGKAMTPEERKAELEALSQPGAPFRLMAMEQQALDALAGGDKPGAIAKAREILAEDGVTSGLQQRATELIVALGGDPAAQ
ncbi:hypothetical protein C8J30_106153 [Rhodobacter viridis]|uniref:Tetratricopeptide repeat-like domain-containing protein n=1 Tax=Rhodobacter viridis TaxID=1054202 RepID=A0A318TYI7_9RHOB|nr:hypothetical protein [Rhodobacter viridis]PYF10021.1 hypothetical protein C8J30_106153 [Rhodobacter viridis]